MTATGGPQKRSAKTALASRVAQRRDLGRASLLALLAWWTWRLVPHPLNWFFTNGAFLHLINLPFHEAGHILFSPFGEFMTILGGSLMQVIVPVVCAVGFVRREDWFGAAVACWWTGESLVDVAPYIADARALRMPLLGGGTGAEVEGHDWEAILTRLGWLQLDRTLGMWAHVIGSVVMVAALIAGAWLLVSRRGGEAVEG